jgi:hypothetical protein
MTTKNQLLEWDKQERYERDLLEAAIMAKVTPEHISALPDMIEALKTAHEDICWMLNNRQFLKPMCLDKIEAALQKAGIREA